MATKPRKLAALKPDPHNANKGTKKGRRALDTSLRDYGFGRSILTDSQDTVIAGNKTMEAALAANPEVKIRVVETDGTELVVVKRTDLNLATDAAAKKLAIADNRVAELDLSWDQDVLEALGGEMDLSSLFGGESTAAAATDAPVPDSQYKEQYGVIVLCATEAEQKAMYERLHREGLTVRVVTT